MDLLVCNKCYKRMENSKRSWSITQCGHIYCNPCIGQMGNKCPQCETVDFSLMPLTNPPKLDGYINYFTNLHDVVDQCAKVMNFQENQMMIAVQAAQHMERKYVMIKEARAKQKKDMEEVTTHIRKLQIDIDNAKRARGSRSNSVARSKENVNADSMDFEASYETQETPFKPITSTRPSSTNSSSSSVSSVKYRDSASGSQKLGYKTARKKNPEYPYNPNPLFSKPGYRSRETSDSGCSTITPSVVERVEGFLVPSISRVPKSAATAKRKTPTGVRIGCPRSQYDFS